MSRMNRAVVVAATAGSVLMGGAGMAGADAKADAAAVGSPGVLSGNIVQVPIHIPINVCGNTVNLVGLLNPAFGNTCINGGDWKKNGDAKQADDGKHSDDGKHGEKGKHGDNAKQGDNEPGGYGDER
ncbi:chaplin [Streptomyces sp. NPDC006368]|uniref:chaplin n=1 Tax=Streptomyces sp. NPDC006368 TaxID=3156760 RepID=UPI0033A2928F